MPSMVLTAGRAGRRGTAQRRCRLRRRPRRMGAALLQIVQLFFKVAVRGRVAVGRGHVEEVLVRQVPLVDDQARRLRRRQHLRTVGELAVEIVDPDAAILVLRGRQPADRFAQRQRAAARIGHHQQPHRPLRRQPLADQPAGKQHRGVGQRLQGNPSHAEGRHGAGRRGNERLGVETVLGLGLGGRRRLGRSHGAGRRCRRPGRSRQRCRPANRNRPEW